MRTSPTQPAVGVRLRLARPADEPFLERLYGATRDDLTALDWSPEVTAGILASQYRARSHHYRQAFPNALDQIVEVGAEPAGRLLTEESGGVTRVIDIALLPERRGHGIGEDLLRSVCSRARFTGGTVQLSVSVGNRAQGLYERLGFSVTHRDPMYLTMEWRAA